MKTVPFCGKILLKKKTFGYKLNNFPIKSKFRTIFIFNMPVSHYLFFFHE